MTADGAVSGAALDRDFRLTALNSERLTASGALTFATARHARELGIALLTGGASGTGGAEVDCSGITATDSAGLAVLIDWLAQARRAGRKLRYANLPAGLTALARISEVEALLSGTS